MIGFPQQQSALSFITDQKALDYVKTFENNGTDRLGDKVPGASE